MEEFPAVATLPAPSGPNRRRITFVGILSAVVLAIGLVTGIYLVRQQQETRGKAFTLLPNPPRDGCNLIEVSVNENTPCTRFGFSGPGTNNVSTYKTTFTLKNTSGQTHTVQYLKASNYCTEPYGQQKSGQGQPVCWDNQVDETLTATLDPGQSLPVVISRTSAGGQACGSFQTDILIKSVDGNTSCNMSAPGAGVCQTGLSCSTPTPTPTPTPRVTPTPTPTPTPTNTPTQPTYRTCVNNACVTVNGSGTSTCNSDVQCQPAATPPPVPQAGIEWPTVLSVGVGAIVLLLGLVL